MLTMNAGKITIVPFFYNSSHCGDNERLRKTGNIRMAGMDEAILQLKDDCIRKHFNRWIASAFVKPSAELINV